MGLRSAKNIPFLTSDIFISDPRSSCQSPLATFSFSANSSRKTPPFFGAPLRVLDRSGLSSPIPVPDLLQLRLMDVAMMNVGPVHMGMLYWFVSVEMVVYPNQFTILVRVLVVLIMLVRMGMVDPFMPVEVAVHFAIKEAHSRKHHHCSHPVLSRGTLSKNYDRKNGADERTRCEPGAGSSRSDFPQCMNEKD